MKTQKLKRMMSLFLAALICVTTLVGFGTTAYIAAAGPFARAAKPAKNV